MDVTFVTYTHTDYSDIWPLTFDGMRHLEQLPIEKVFVCNTETVGEEVLTRYHSVIAYDDSLPYPARVASCLEQITSEYVLFVHDIDVILKFDASMFSHLFDTIKTHSIDRLFFGMVKPCDDMIHTNTLSLARAKRSPIFALPYDVGPSIWKRSVFLDMMRKYSKETYRSIETSGIQSELASYRCYAIAPNPHYFPLFHLARPMSHKFVFLHILASGKWFDLLCYMDLQSDLMHLLTKYNISTSIRGIGSGYHLFHVSRSLE
jgi:hypothetical protein